MNRSKPFLAAVVAWVLLAAAPKLAGPLRIGALLGASKEAAMGYVARDIDQTSYGPQTPRQHSITPENLTAQRTFVASTGSDGNPCSRSLPCRNFAQALLSVAPGGEVVVLDSAGYGAFSITQSVTIEAPPGVYAGVTSFSGDAIDVNAGPSDKVVLRGLTVNSQGGANGIVFNSGGTLDIESCVVNGFSGDGIQINGPGALFIRNTISRDNSRGIASFPSSQLAILTVESVCIEGNVEGFGVFERTVASIKNSVVSGNTDNGIVVNPTVSGTVGEANIESCLLMNNQFSAVTSEGANGGAGTVRISNSTLTNNAGGLRQAAGGVLLSRGNNTVEGNTTNTSGTIGAYSAK